MRKTIIHALRPAGKQLKQVHASHRHLNGKILMASFGCMGVIALGSYFAADREAPKIKQSTMAIDYGSTLSKNNIKISDNRESKKDLIIHIDKSHLNVKKLGSYTVKVKATDSYNNTTVRNVKINVVDHEAPVVKGIHSDGDYILVEAGGSTDLSKYLTITDNVDGNLFAKAKFSKALSTSAPGIQTIGVEVADSSGNVTKKNLPIKVLDSQPPEWQDVNTDHTINFGDDFDISKYIKAVDNLDGDVRVDTIGTVNTKKLGSQTITIQATDSSGHSTKKTVTFTVKYLKGPEITVKDENVTLKPGDAFDPKAQITSVTDNVDGKIDVDKVQIDSNVDTSKKGSYQVTYTVKDQAGNTTTKVLKVEVNNEGELMVQYGKQYLNVPYVFGGTTPDGFDCSGFTGWVYKKFGKSLPRTAAAQYDATTRVEKKDLQIGDLVFFSNTYKPGVSHVGIYMGDGKMVDASGDHVQIDDINTGYWAAHYTSGGRYKTK